MFRKLSLHLCEWDLGEDALRERLDRLVINGEPERAAAMALFNNRLSWTIEILSGLQNSPNVKNFGEYMVVINTMKRTRKNLTPKREWNRFLTNRTSTSERLFSRNLAGS